MYVFHIEDVPNVHQYFQMSPTVSPMVSSILYILGTDGQSGVLRWFLSGQVLHNQT